MDPIVLVEKEVEDGRQLLLRLTNEEFPVTAAGWIKEHQDPDWYLFIASPIVDAEGHFEAYGHLNAVIKQMPQPFWLNKNIKLIGAKEKLTKAMREVQQRYPGGNLIPYRRTTLGGKEIDGAFLYPATIGVPATAG